MKYCICILLLISPLAKADVETVMGRWVTYSKGGVAIIGTITVSENSVTWGVTKNDALPCKARYDYSYDEAEELHIIKLKNKECDYENLANAHISTKVKQWNIEIAKKQPSRSRIKAKFREYNDKGSLSGVGVRYKYIPKPAK